MNIRYFIPLFICGILLASCANKGATQAQLERADSLMWSAPDSAYHIVQSINRDSINTDAQRAYYGLIYTQAQYKNYVPLTSDSLILRSVLYYEDRDDYKYGLSLYYLGAVYQDKEFYDLAIEQYKRALEYISEENNPKETALLHSSMGHAYYEQYFAQKAIDHYLQTEPLYRNLSDSARLSFLYDDMGNAYRMVEERDSAIQYYNQSLALARQLGDSIQIGMVQNRMAWLYEECGRFAEAKQWLLSSIVLNADQTPTSNQWLLMGQIALAEEKIDSALYYLAQKPSHSLAEDKLRSEVYYAKGQYREAHDAFQDYFDKTTNMLEERDRIRIDEIAAQYDQQQLIQDKKYLIQALWIWSGIGGLLLLLLVAAIVVFVGRRRRYKAEANSLIESLGTLQERSNNLRETHGKLILFLEKRLMLLAQWTELSHLHKDNEKSFVRKIRTLIEQNPLDEKEAQTIVSTMNDLSNGVIDHLRQGYPKLNEQDLLVCALTYMGYSSQQLYAILSARNVQSIYDKKYKIVCKMELSGDLKKALDQIVVVFRTEKTLF